MYIYLHIPFCKSKCTYCDFVSGAYSQAIQDKYIDALLKEIDGVFASESRQKGKAAHTTDPTTINRPINIKSACLEPSCENVLQSTNEESSLKHMVPLQIDAKSIRTIYIGGGTPSSLSIQNLTRLFNKLAEYIHLESLEEFTIECNPESVSEDLLVLLTKYHVNRISLGVQSADEDELKFLNRIHSFEQVRKSVQIFKQYGITNYSLDLMFNLPNQTMNMLQRSLSEFLALNPTHISCYSLIIEEGTPMMKLLEARKITEQSDENYIRQYRMIIDTLAKHGYRQYEISGFAKTGYEAIHNSAYWTGKDYLGLGVAAHSSLENIRFANERDVEKYIERAQEDFCNHPHKYDIPTFFEANSILEKSEISNSSIRQESILLFSPFIDSDSVEQLSATDKLNELFFLGLRRNVGITQKEIEQKISSLPKEEQEGAREKIFQSIDKLRRDGLLHCEQVTPQNSDNPSDIRITLTQKGREISNSVFVELMVE